MDRSSWNRAAAVAAFQFYGPAAPSVSDLRAAASAGTMTFHWIWPSRGNSRFRRGHGISVAGTADCGAVVQRARELVEIARRHGHQVDELIEIIGDVS